MGTDLLRPDAASVFGVVWLVMAPIVGISGNSVALGFGWLALPFALIAVHEVGHAAAGVTVGIPRQAVRIAIGVGPQVRLLGGYLRLGPMPGGGQATLDPSGGLSRRQHVVFALGGVVSNLIFTGVLAVIAANVRGGGGDWLPTIALASLAMAVGNLVPLRGRRLAVHGTDGYQVLDAVADRSGRRVASWSARVSQGRLLALEPEARTADPDVPAFVARPHGAPVYHGFPLLENVSVEGFMLGKISDFEADEMTYGDAYVVAPDGRRAGLVWQVGTELQIEQVLPPEPGRWGVWSVTFRHPMRTRDDARANLADIVPLLKPKWEATA